MLAELVRRSRDTLPDELPRLISAGCAALGFDVILYLVDHEQRRLWPMPEPGRPTPPPVAVDGTPGGRAFTSVATQRHVDRHGDVWLWIPMVDGAERLGLAEIRGRAAPASLGRLQRNAETAVTLLAQLVTIKLAYGDALHRTRRTRPMHPSGELLLSMVPPPTFRCRQMLIAAVLEPSYGVGGDAYDYAVDGSTAIFIILDSMGRGIQAALTTAAVLAAIRAARRAGRGLYDMAVAADTVLTEQFGNHRFTTGVLAHLDTRTGRLRYLNAGHPAPILIREGRAVRTLDHGRRLPLGFDDSQIDIGTVQLEPGDRVLLYTDGVTDPRDREQAATGSAWLSEIARWSIATGLAASEVLRLVSQTVMAYGGKGKPDDATLMLVEWSPEEPGPHDG
jgi:hypothetical protein